MRRKGGRFLDLFSRGAGLVDRCGRDAGKAGGFLAKSPCSLHPRGKVGAAGNQFVPSLNGFLVLALLPLCHGQIKARLGGSLVRLELLVEQTACLLGNDTAGNGHQTLGKICADFRRLRRKPQHIGPGLCRLTVTAHARIDRRQHLPATHIVGFCCEVCFGTRHQFLDALAFEIFTLPCRKTLIGHLRIAGMKVERDGNDGNRYDTGKRNHA